MSPRRRTRKKTVQVPVLPVSEEPISRSRPAWLIPLVVFGIALIPRVIHLAVMSQGLWLKVPLIDAWEHHTAAVSISRGTWLWEAPLFKAPGYLYWLGIVYSIFGINIVLATFFQMVLGGLSCVFVYLFGRRLVNRAAGIVGAMLYAFHGPAIHQETWLEIVNLEIPLVLLGLWFLLESLDKRCWWRFLLTGFVFGCAGTVRPTILLFIPLLLPWLLWKLRPVRKSVFAVGMLLVGVTIPILPIAIRNTFVLQDPILISANGGINFYIGNNEEFERTLAIQPGYEWDRLIREPQRLGLMKKLSDQSTYFYGKAFSYIRSQPLGWIGLLVRKAGLFLSARELSRNYSYDALRSESPILALPLPSFGILFPLAFIGVWTMVRKKNIGPGWIPMGIYYVSVWLTNIIFFVDSRYRLAGTPVLVLPVGYVLVEGYRAWQRKETRIILKWGWIAIALGLLMALDPGGARKLENWPDLYYRARIIHKLAGVTAQSGNPANAEALYSEAETLYRQALREREALVDSANNLASLLMAKGRYQEARQIVMEGLAMDGEYLELLGNLGICEYYLGNPSASVNAFRKALFEVSTNQRLRYFLARSLVMDGKNEEAFAELETLVESGFTDRGLLEREPGFESLHASEKWQALLERLR